MNKRMNESAPPPRASLSPSPQGLSQYSHSGEVLQSGFSRPPFPPPSALSLYLTVVLEVTTSGDKEHAGPIRGFCRKVVWRGCIGQPSEFHIHPCSRGVRILLCASAEEDPVGAHVGCPDGMVSVPSKPGDHVAVVRSSQALTPRQVLSGSHVFFFGQQSFLQAISPTRALGSSLIREVITLSRGEVVDYVSNSLVSVSSLKKQEVILEYLRLVLPLKVRVPPWPWMASGASLQMMVKAMPVRGSPSHYKRRSSRPQGAHSRGGH